ncbi:MAG: spermidine/putrescine ABC transporter substrate-binding protein [Proteobacteria bacterium]|nr:spermidine/putrescine ABC transporter substrate-binding protein [Pseudomonadota bacterium]
MRKFGRSLISQVSRRAFMQGSVAAVGITFVGGANRAWSAEEKQLNVYNWDTYIGETTLDTFTKSTGIAVQYDLFGDNEEMFAKLKEGNPGYDIIVPTDYMVEDMISLGMVVPLDHSKIPNLKHLDSAFTDPAYDPGMKYGIPYMWGTLGFGYKESAVDGVPNSWADVLEPERAKKHSGRIALLSDSRAVIGCALKYMGYPMNSINPKEIAKARDLLIAVKPHIKTFAADNGQDLLVAGEVDITMEWSGDIAAVMQEEEGYNYVVPKEGSNVWVDSICIPKGAPHPENAHKFINHVHDVDVNVEISNTIYFATANKDAKARMPPEYTDNPAVFAPADVLSRCEGILSVGDNTRLYDEAWTAIQAS